MEKIVLIEIRQWSCCFRQIEHIKSTRVLYFGTKYSTRYLICAVICKFAWNCYLGRISVHDKISIKERRKKDGSFKQLLHVCIHRKCVQIIYDTKAGRVTIAIATWSWWRSWFWNERMPYVQRKISHLFFLKTSHSVSDKFS